MFTRHFDRTLLWILPYISSVQCQCAASIMDKKSNVQPCKHTEDPHCCRLWYYSAFSFVLGFFFFLTTSTLQPWFTLVQPFGSGSSSRWMFTPLGTKNNVRSPRPQVAPSLEGVTPPQNESHLSMTAGNPAGRSDEKSTRI